MVLKKFYINCIIRVLLLSGTLCLLAYLIFGECLTWMKAAGGMLILTRSLSAR